jgi:hypothetical protein
MSGLADFVGGSLQRAVVMTLDRVIIDVLVLAIAFIIPDQPRETVNFLMYALFLSMLLLVVRDLVGFWKEGTLQEKFFGPNPRAKPVMQDASQPTQIAPEGQPKFKSEVIARLETARKRALGERAANIR